MTPLAAVDTTVNNRNYDYSYEFYMSDKENDVDTMNKCKSMLRNLLV